MYGRVHLLSQIYDLTLNVPFENTTQSNQNKQVKMKERRAD